LIAQEENLNLVVHVPTDNRILTSIAASHVAQRPQFPIQEETSSRVQSIQNANFASNEFPHFQFNTSEQVQGIK
jgi:hypothetical protein